MHNGEPGSYTNQRFLLAGSPYNKGQCKRLYCDKSNVMSEGRRRRREEKKKSEREKERGRKSAHMCISTRANEISGRGR